MDCWEYCPLVTARLIIEVDDAMVRRAAERLNDFFTAEYSEDAARAALVAALGTRETEDGHLVIEFEQQDHQIQESDG